MSDNDAGQLSWSDSEDDTRIDAANDPQSPPRTPSKSHAQLLTPPQSRIKGARHALATTDVSPHKISKQTAEILTLVEERPELDYLAQRLKTHLLRQERLLDATRRSRVVLRSNIVAMQKEIADLRYKVTCGDAERETNRSILHALRHDLAQKDAMQAKSHSLELSSI